MASGEDIVNLAKRYLGVQYQWGGTTPGASTARAWCSTPSG
jgi:cell wall-associated NlpC family hydrolase